MNILDEILQQQREIKDRLAAIEQRSQPGPKRIPFTEFCKQKHITRPTGYAWAERGLIKTEMIGGRRFVLSDSIMVEAKYQREANQPVIHTR